MKGYRAGPALLLPLAGGIICVLAACRSDRPFASYLTPTPLPTMDCARFSRKPSEPGWTWQGITVGSSTEQDVVAHLGQPASRDHPVCSGLTLYSYDDSDLRVWFADGLVDGIDLSLRPSGDKTSEAALALPPTLHDARQMYGEPELVGWRNRDSREVVWLTRGVGAYVVIDPYGSSSYPEYSQIYSISFFLPQSADDFIASHWGGYQLSITPGGGYVPEDRNAFDHWLRWPVGGKETPSVP